MHTAIHHEVTLVQLSFDIYMIEARPANLIGRAPRISVRTIVERTIKSVLRFLAPFAFITSRIPSFTS